MKTEIYKNYYIHTYNACLTAAQLMKDNLKSLSWFGKNVKYEGDNDHEVSVVKLGKIYPHNNADSLEITYIDDWQVVVRKGEYKEGDLAIYIEPDYMVLTDTKEFSFLKKEGKPYHRLKAIRLRGEISYGLLIHAKPHHKVGDNVIQEYGIERYVPIISGKNTYQDISPDWYPTINTPKFSVHQMKKKRKILFPDENEIVVASVKIHGANARFVYHNNILYVGSRTRWMFLENKDVENTKDSVWHRTFTEDMRKIAIDNPDVIYYGEVYGPSVQKFQYGLKEPEFIMFAAYDSKSDKWLNISEDDFKPFVPTIFEGPVKDLDYTIAEMDDPVSKKKGDIMEGFVVKPKVERHDGSYGRVIAKVISDRYWLVK